MRLIHYKDDQLHAICVPDTMTLREAMAVMNANSLRLVPVVSAADRRLVGVLADGDIRRYLAGPGTTDDPVRLAANTRPLSHDGLLEAKDARQEMQRRGVEYLPVVREGGLSPICSFSGRSMRRWT